MVGKLLLLLVALLALSGTSEGKESVHDEPSDRLIDIDYYAGNDISEGSGRRGEDKDVSSDDEDLSGSGSGSGDGGPEISEETTVTKAPLTPCQNLREASKHLFGNFVPRCTPNGDYDIMQCRGYPGTGKCWCTDKTGREIPATAMGPSAVPDCVKGTNLPPCIFKMMKTVRKGLLGSYRPRCTTTGEFEKEQCHGSKCFCVDEAGRQIKRTEVYMPNRPNCEPQITTEKTTTTTTTEKENIKPLPEYTVKPSDDNKTMINIDDTVTLEVNTSHEKVESEEATEDSSNNAKPPNERIDDPHSEPRDSVSSAAITTQPGLLAAIVGGAVVGLLCAILLVMFIVYRMRKKDEGSYALDEPRKLPTYSPINTQDKEYYA